MSGDEPIRGAAGRSCGRELEKSPIGRRPRFTVGGGRISSQSPAASNDMRDVTQAGKCEECQDKEASLDFCALSILHRLKMQTAGAQLASHFCIFTSGESCFHGDVFKTMFMTWKRKKH